MLGIEAIQELVEWLARDATTRPWVQRIVLYGSFARGDATQGSDVDLAFFMEAPERWSEWAASIRGQARTLRALDLVCFNEAPEELRDRILAEGKVIFERPR